jgi:hypothetical protein
MGVHDLSAWLPVRAPKWQVVWATLLESHSYAQDVGGDPWDFAVEVDRLRSVGLTTNDLRWLVAKHLIEHSAGSDKQAPKRSRRAIQRSTARRKSLIFTARSRIILTDSGLSFALSACHPPAMLPLAGEPPSEHNSTQLTASRSPASDLLSPTSDPSLAAALPRWDATTRTLWLGACEIKRYRVPAPNQELVLAAFEEEGWPTHIDDPLPPTQEVDSKHRLHDTIIRLNRGHKHPLIRFHGNGNGLAIHWQRLSPSSTVTKSTPKRR